MSPLENYGAFVVAAAILVAIPGPSVLFTVGRSIARAKAGMKVGVIGLGGLGCIVARCAALVGAEVYGAEINPETRELNPPINRITHADIPEAIDKLRDGGVVGRFIAVYE